MDNNSIWKKYLNYDINKSNITKKTDILIIGGGICGLSTAYFLKDSKYDVTLIDKGNVCSGITLRTTAKVNYLQKDIYTTLTKKYDKNVSKLYLDSQLDAINLLLKIIKDNNIDCDLEKCDSYIFTKEKKGIKAIKKEKELLDEFNIKSSMQNKIPIKNFKILSSLKVSDTYTINPIKYLNGIIKSIKNDVKIIENTLAYNIKCEDNYFIVETTNGTIKCKYVLLCCFYPFFILPGLIPIKTYIKREYVNACKYPYDRHFTAISIDNTLHSIRFYNDYIIYGSNSHRSTNDIDYLKKYKKSQIDFKRLFSKEPEYTWMNHDIMTNGYLPLIGKVNDNKNLMIATGFNAWGMTNATIAGKLLSDLVLNRKNIYEELFSPRNINIPNIVNSLIGSFNYAKVYIQNTIKKNPVFYNDKVYTVKINGKYYGVYFDNYDKKHIVSLKCPHMKCNLVFNNFEKTWDCPCHGSRFDIDGNIINGPSKENIKK